MLRDAFKRHFVTPVSESVPLRPNHPMSMNESMPQRVYDPLMESAKVLAEEQVLQYTGRDIPLNKFTLGQTTLASSLMAKFTKAVNDRVGYYRISQEMRMFYLAYAVLRLVTSDVLNPDKNGEIVEMSSPNPKYQEKLAEFQANIDIDSVVKNFALDLIDYGEYTLRLQVIPGKGVVKIFDDMIQTSIVALYEEGVPVNFLLYENGNFFVKDACDYAHFVVGPNKERIKTNCSMETGSAWVDTDRLPESVKNVIPDYIRVGMPFFWGVVQKMRELMILDNLIPALKLNQITASKLVAVKIPAGADPKMVQATLMKYRNVLNQRQGLNISQGTISMADIIEVADRIEVLPDFSDEKGSLEALNIRDDQTVDDLLKAIEDMRKTILSSMGIPYELIFGGGSSAGGEGGDNSRANEIRRNGRYVRMLAEIQRSIGLGLRQLALTHLINSGETKATLADVEVLFKNSFVDLSELEKLEYNSTKLAIIREYFEYYMLLKTDQDICKTLSLEGIYKSFKAMTDDITGGISWFKEDLYPDDDALKRLEIDGMSPHDVTAKILKRFNLNRSGLPHVDDVQKDVLNRFLANRGETPEVEIDPNDEDAVANLVTSIMSKFEKNRTEKEDS